MLFDEPVQLANFALGRGSVILNGVSLPCQYSSFALPRAVRPASIVLADPLMANAFCKFCSRSELS